MIPVDTARETAPDRGEEPERWVYQLADYEPSEAPIYGEYPNAYGAAVRRRLSMIPSPLLGGPAGLTRCLLIIQ